MSAMRAEAIQLIDSVPEDRILDIVQYIKGIQSQNQGSDRDERMAAFYRLDNMGLNLPEGFDEKKDLAEALEEKYGCFD